jgi:hypothetical protein
MLTDLQVRINPDAEYQRGSVWTDAQQRLLIDSLLRGYDLPKLYFRKLSEGGKYLYEVIDGKQRLTAIWHFMKNDLRLPPGSVFDGLGNLSGKSWLELPGPAQDRLQFTKVTVSEIEDATPVEIAELFLRLQKGEPLRAAEKRNAVIGPVRDFVSNTLVRHSVFPLLGMKDYRFTWAELAAITLQLAKHDGPVSVKGADLGDLYDDQGFSPDDESAFETISMLDDLEAFSFAEPGLISTRWGFIDLMLSLRKLRHDGIHWDAEHVVAFFKAFELERRDASTKLAEFREEIMDLDPAQLDSESPSLIIPDVDSEMFLYVSAFSREGATEQSIRTRSEIMSRRLRTYLTSHE